MSPRAYLDFLSMARRLDRRFIPWIAAHFLEFWFWYLGAFISLYALHRLQTLIPSELKKLTDVAAETGQLPPAPVGTFLLIALGILVFRTLSRLLFFTPARYQQKFLRTEMLELLEQSPPARYAAWNDGQLYQVLFNDFNGLRGFIGFALLQIGNVIVAAWVMIPRLNEADPGLWQAFIPMGVSVLVFSVLTAIFQKFSKRALNAQGEVQNHVIEAYSAKATVKNYHREETFINRFKELSSFELGLFFKSSVGFAFSVPMIRLGVGASLLWGAWILRARGAGASELVFFAGYLFLMLEPLMFLSWMAVVSSQGYAAWGRVKGLYAVVIKPHDEEALWSQQISQDAASLRFQLPYWEQKLDLTINIGSWTVLCGETGSGKSELLKKMAFRLSSTGTKFAMVQQEPYLFNDTVEANIFLGRVPTEEERKHASELLRLFGLDVLSTGAEALLSLEVGENGKRLSGGQAKRLALVRSLLAEAKVVLWDDPFSSVDILLERKIIQALRLRVKDQTFILTSHRLTTVKTCDRTLLLDPEVGVKAEGGPKAVEVQEGALFDFFREQVHGAALS
jgi:ABC-type multidrug transport system fused ATPase/permease subunit